jgi:hypothetical protein
MIQVENSIYNKCYITAQSLPGWGWNALENGVGKCWKRWSMIKKDRFTTSDEHMHQFLECLRFQSEIDMYNIDAYNHSYTIR